MSVQLKNKEEIELMRVANMIVYEVLGELEQMVAPGITTADLNARALELVKKRGARPAFLDYPSHKPEVPAFPGVICASRNEAIVHGIPNDVPLEEGDIISIDFGCEKDGFFGDSARTFAVGEISKEAKKLLDVTSSSLEAAIQACKPNGRLGDIGSAVQSMVEKAGFGVVREFVGQGIGRAMHEPPQVPNFGTSGQGRKLKVGMVLAIEPMVTMGEHSVSLLDDGWTAVTQDRSLAAHFEHTVAITAAGADVLSRPK